MNIVKIKQGNSNVFINLDLAKNIRLRTDAIYFSIDGENYDDAEARKVIESYLSKSVENTKVLLQG